MVNEYEVHYKRGNSELCPVATLKRYLNIYKNAEKEKCSTVLYKSERTLPFPLNGSGHRERIFIT